jgi:hypothetical protein
MLPILRAQHLALVDPQPGLGPDLSLDLDPSLELDPSLDPSPDLDPSLDPGLDRLLWVFSVSLGFASSNSSSSGTQPDYTVHRVQWVAGQQWLQKVAS